LLFLHEFWCTRAMPVLRRWLAALAIHPDFSGEVGGIIA
jgi:hypothetical protein